jgi:hypothetical protein
VKFGVIPSRTRPRLDALAFLGSKNRGDSTVADNRTPPTRQRAAERRCLTLAARLTWKDASGAVRFVSVTTRDISDAGAFVEADGATAIPLYRLVHVQLERQAREADGVPEQLRDGRILSAVWRVAPCRATTGTPAGYALRFLVEPATATNAAVVNTSMAVAS